MIAAATAAALLLKIDPRIIVFGLIAFIVLMVVMATAWERRRKRDLAALLEGRGFTLTPKPAGPEQESHFSSFAALSDLRDGASGVRWAASGRLAGRPAQIIEHSYTVRAGKHNHTVVNLCVAVAGGGDWPLLALSGESVLDRLGEKLGRRADLKLEDEAFNRRWRIRCDDEGFALAVLTPEVQAAIGQGEPGDWWAFGGPSGLACLGRRATVTAPKLEPMLARLETVLNALPPETRAGLGL